MKLSILKLVGLAMIFAATPAALASTWYVNGVSGRDSNNCKSTLTACKTIGHAISLASSRDTMIVAAAKYTESLTIGFSLEVIGSGASTTIIDGRCFGTVISISNAAASVTLSNVTVRNGCARYAGGISNRGTLRIIASTISGNRAGISHKSGSAGGGGIYNYAALTISDSTVAGNAVGATNCMFCDAYGGGVANAISATLTINNSTLNGNLAISFRGICYRFQPCPAFGGGIYNEGTVMINNSTLSGNAASPFLNGGGGISGTATLQNSILANNSGANCRTTITSNGYNLSSDGTCNFKNAGDLNNTDPMLGTLGNYGGPTQTIPLLSGSPAIDAGNPSGCTDGHGHLLKTDQRGMPRPDTEDKTGCDMGAYERQGD